MGGKAYRSMLNPFLDVIRKGIKNGKTWREIAEQITDQGTPTSRQAVQAFYARAKERRFWLPSGFEKQVEPDTKVSKQIGSTEVKRPPVDTKVSSGWMPKSKWNFGSLDEPDPELDEVVQSLISEAKNIVPFQAPPPPAPASENYPYGFIPRSIWDTLTPEEKQAVRDGDPNVYSRHSERQKKLL
jgi:hypothetical protein